jgi:hypothetical protein
MKIFCIVLFVLATLSFTAQATAEEYSICQDCGPIIIRVHDDTVYYVFISLNAPDRETIRAFETELQRLVADGWVYNSEFVTRGKWRLGELICMAFTKEGVPPSFLKRKVKPEVS